MRRGLPFSLLILMQACAALSANPGEVTYVESAQENFQLGMKEFQDGNWLEASQFFEHVRTKYPYSQYAALAELRLADTSFSEGHYAEAIDQYKNFTKFRPTHPDADWASFRIGESHVKAMPSDFFIFPPETEKDQTEARAARTSLHEFLAGYPDSTYRPRATEMLKVVTDKLADHELNIAGFDEKKERWQGAALRYQYLLDNYPESDRVGIAAKGLLHAEAQLGQQQKAKESLERFLQQHPGATGVEAALRGKG